MPRSPRTADVTNLETVDQPAPSSPEPTFSIMVYMDSSEKPVSFEFSDKMAAKKLWKSVNLAIAGRPRPTELEDGSIIIFGRILAATCDADTWAVVKDESENV